MPRNNDALEAAQCGPRDERIAQTRHLKVIATAKHSLDSVGDGALVPRNGRDIDERPRKVLDGRARNHAQSHAPILSARHGPTDEPPPSDLDQYRVERGEGDLKSTLLRKRDVRPHHVDRVDDEKNRDDEAHDAPDPHGAPRFLMRLLAQWSGRYLLVPRRRNWRVSAWSRRDIVVFRRPRLVHGAMVGGVPS